MSGLLPWEEYTWDRPFPYIREYEQGNKKLFYFGSNHSYDLTDNMFESIRTSMASFNPHVVLIEGSQKLRRGRNPEVRAELLSWVGTTSSNEIIRSWGEPGYSTWLAHRSNIPVYSAEPDQTEEVSALEKLNFSRDEIFLHYLLGDIDQYHRMGGGNFEEYISKNFQMFIDSTKWQGFDYSLAHLQAIAERIWPSKVNFLDFAFVEEKVWPTKWESVVNEIARASCDFRDLYIVDEIKHHLRESDRVFIIYGGSHLIRQEPVLNAMFDKSR